MALINEWTQVYLHGGLPEEYTNNLKNITVSLNDGKRTPQQIYAVLKGMGIPTEKCLFAIKSYINPKAEINLGFYDATKNNQYRMKKFDHRVLAEKIESLIENLKIMVEEDKTKMNYSAQISSETAKRYLNEINGVIIKLDEIKKKDELSEKVKSRTNRSDLTGRSEFYFASKLINEINAHDWVKPVGDFISEIKEIFEANKYTAMVSSTIKTLSGDRKSAFYEKAVADLEFLITKDEKEIIESMKSVLGQHQWIPSIKTLLSIRALDEKELVSNLEGNVSKVFSPVIVNEDKSIIFSLDNKYYNIKDNELTEADITKLNGKFLNAQKALTSFKVINEKFTMYKGKHVLSIDPENNEIKVNTKVVEHTDLKNYLIKSSFFNMNEMYKLEEVMFLLEAMDTIKELDFVTSVTSNVDTRIKVNILRLEENIYVNRINPQMMVNEMMLAQSAEKAQLLVNEYVKFDISNSTIDLLEKEVQIRVELEKEKDSLIEKINFLEEKKTKVENTIGMIGEKHELLKALEIIDDELKTHEVKLQQVYSKLGEALTEAKKMEDQGYVPGKMKKNDGPFKKNHKVWVFAEDYTTKADKEDVKVTDEKGGKEGTVIKKNVEMVM